MLEKWQIQANPIANCVEHCVLWLKPNKRDRSWTSFFWTKVRPGSPDFGSRSLAKESIPNNSNMTPKFLIVVPAVIQYTASQGVPEVFKNNCIWGLWSLFEALVQGWPTLVLKWHNPARFPALPELLTAKIRCVLSIGMWNHVTQLIGRNVGSPAVVTIALTGGYRVSTDEKGVNLYRVRRKRAQNI